MNVAQTTDEAKILHRWGSRTPQVRKALRWMKRRGGMCQVDELVAWDAHQPLAQRLFTWDDETAAEKYRLHEARLFLNRFRGVFDNMRVRGIIHIHEDESAGIPESAYVTVEKISQHAGMRAQVVADITKRMTVLASELKMWDLTTQERSELFRKLDEALSGERRAPKVA